MQTAAGLRAHLGTIFLLVLMTLGFAPAVCLGMEPALRGMRFAAGFHRLAETAALTSERRTLDTAHGVLDVYLTVLPVTGHRQPPAGSPDRTLRAFSPAFFRAGLKDLRPAASEHEARSKEATAAAPLAATSEAATSSANSAATTSQATRALAVEVLPFVTEKGALTFSFLAYAFDAPRTRLLTTLDAPVSGPAAEWQAVCAAAAQRLETELRMLADRIPPYNIPPVISGPRPAGPAGAAAPRPLADTWEVLPAPRPLRYRFAPPIEDYGGVVTRARGRVRLTAGLGDAPRIVAARFVTDVASLSTGAEDLDDSLHSDMFLDVTRYPEAAFELWAVRDVQGALADQEGLRMTLAGHFSLKERRVPLNAYVTLSRSGVEPEREQTPERQQAQERLRLRGHFALNIRQFDLWPPEGPEPAQHIMLFELDFLLGPLP